MNKKVRSMNYNAKYHEHLRASYTKRVGVVDSHNKSNRFDPLSAWADFHWVSMVEKKFRFFSHPLEIACESSRFPMLSLLLAPSMQFELKWWWILYSWPLFFDELRLSYASISCSQENNFFLPFSILHEMLVLQKKVIC